MKDKKEYFMERSIKKGDEWVKHYLFAKLNNNERREHLKQGWLIYVNF